MKKVLLNLAILFVFVSLSILSSCKDNDACVQGSGSLVTESRKAGEFKKIEISGNYKLHIRQDSSLMVSVKADDNLLEYISTSIHGDRLIVSSKKSFCTNNDIVITLGVHNLNEISTSGDIEIITDTKFKTGDLILQLSGSTKANMDVTANNITTRGSGDANIHLQGQAASNLVDLSGSVKLDAYNFVVGDYNILASGSTECDINVLKTLNVKSSGDVNVRYKGSPATVNSIKSGSLTLTKVN